MKCLLAMVIVLCPASTALGWPSLFAPEPPQTPHPAVVRIIAPERDGYSMGSGSLVAVDARYGMVVTNWHVVRDASGPPTVVFSNGFRSGAVVLKVDRDWDLAALAIQRPNIQPIVLSTEPPRLGDALTIAGYGPSGSYRAVTGRCTEYLSPGGRFPSELIELDVVARKGDSGGPIFNSRGELAGVLFGANWTSTMGSYCGRVRVFLVSAYGDFQRLPGNQAMLAEAPPPSAPPPAAINVPPPPLVANYANPSPPAESNPSRPMVPIVRPSDTQISQPPGVQSPVSGYMVQNPEVAGVNVIAQPREPQGSAVRSAMPAPAVDALPTRAEQIKTILAAIGVLSLLFHGIRLVGSAVG